MTTEEKKALAMQKREQLKGLSDMLKNDEQFIAETEADTVNELLIAFYKMHNGVTELNTFEGWKKKGYAVKKGEKSFLIWGKPQKLRKKNEATEEGEKEPTTAKFFPVCYLFDIKQVHAINK